MSCSAIPYTRSCSASEARRVSFSGDWSVGQPIVAQPVTMGKWLLLPTKDNRLLLIDPATGDSPRYFQLPQAVRLPPVVDAAHGLIFLAAEHSNLIVLDAERMPAGLARGTRNRKDRRPRRRSWATSCWLAVNDTPGEAAIRVFSISKDKEGEPLKPVQTIRVPGSIDTAPVAVGSGAAVVTAEGSLFALERTEADDGPPFQVVASKPVSLKEKATHYAVSDGGTFWVADRQLTRYAVHADEHRIELQDALRPGHEIRASTGDRR